MRKIIGLCLGILFVSPAISWDDIKVPQHKFGDKDYEFGKSDYKKSFLKFAFKRGFGHCTYPKGDCDTSKICDDDKKLNWCRQKCGHKIDIEKVHYEYCVKPKELEEQRRQ